MDVAEVKDRLGLAEPYDEWLRLLAAAPAVEVAPLTDVDAARLLPRLGIAPEDAAALLELQPGGGTDPAWTWLLERTAGALLSGLGSPEPSPPAPELPAALGARGRLFAAWAYLSVLPSVLRRHEERGVPEAVSWATFADLGLHLAIHRRMHGTAGLDAPWWLQPHFRGALFRLGRLQFARHRAPFGPATAVPGLRPRELALDVHIPEDGPLDAAACDASFAAAARFFPERFPEDRSRVVTCTSWLLDEQLAAHLPAESNILRFQRRFTLLPGAVGDGDRDVVFFVFRREGATPEELPRRTRLERAVADHLASGGHWQVRRGWRELG
ncbi:MAG: acyltransferase domain-containing protein [Catenulispora sp.]